MLGDIIPQQICPPLLQMNAASVVSGSSSSIHGHQLKLLSSLQEKPFTGQVDSRLESTDMQLWNREIEFQVEIVEKQTWLLI